MGFLTKKRIIYAVIIVLLAIIGFFALNGENGKKTVAITRGEVIQQVSATGKVEPSQDVDLGFDRSGRVGAVYVNVGDSVEAGQIIASLEAADLSADVAKARALLNEEEIRLRELQSTAPRSFSDANKNLEASIRDGFVAADNAVRNRADQFFKNVPQNPQFEVKFTNGNFVHYFDVPSDVAINLNQDRKEVELILNTWEARLQGLTSSNSLSEATAMISDLNKVSTFLGDVAQAINTFTPAEFEYETTVTTYKSTISSARTEVANATSALVAAKDKINSAPVIGESGEFESVLVQEAKVSQARAALNSLQASLGKASIVAPFSGVITKQDAKVGAAVSAGTDLVSLTSQNQMYIEANISEINIGKIMVGNPAAVGFDAFPGESFGGKVSFIEPGDIVLEGVVNYKIRVELDNFDPRIKKGLTANLDIETSKKSGVVKVPLYALKKEGDTYFASKIVGKEIEKVPVEIGLVGFDGVAEVVSGVEEGDTLEF